MTQYRVIAPVIVAKVMTESGFQYQHLHKGAPVPPEVEPQWIEWWLRDQLIAPVAGTEDAPAEEEAQPAKEPDPPVTTATIPPVTPQPSPPASSPVRGGRSAKGS